MKDNLILEDRDVDALLHAISFMADVAAGEITQVDYFTNGDINAFTVACKFFYPLVKKIHEERYGKV